MDELIFMGDAVKALDDAGRVGGYLVRFTDASQKDLVGDYFTTTTYFGARDGDGCDTLFHHGIPVAKGLENLADHIFSPIKTKKDDVGIFAETVLSQADKYEAKVLELVKAGKIGWSSGSSNHLVKREKDGEIKRWIISEGSLTHTPCDPLNKAVSIKSFSELEFDGLEVKGAVGGWTTEGDYIHYRIKDPADFEDKSFRTITIKKDKPVIKAVIGKLKGESSTTLQNLMFLTSDWTMAEAKKWVKDHPDTKKSFDVKAIDGQALFNESLRQTEQQIWELWSALQTGARKIAEAAALSGVTGTPVDIREALTGLVGAFNPQFIESATLQIEDWLKSENRDEHFYLKSSLLDEFIASGEVLVSDATLEDHSARVVSAVAEFAQQAEAFSQPLKAWLMRLKDKQEFRAHDPLKVGRMISNANRQELQKVLDALVNLDSIKEAITALLTASEKPQKSIDPDTARGLVAKFEMLKMERTLTAGR